MQGIRGVLCSAMNRNIGRKQINPFKIQIERILVFQEDYLWKQANAIELKGVTKRFGDVDCERQRGSDPSGKERFLSDP